VKRKEMRNKFYKQTTLKKTRGELRSKRENVIHMNLEIRVLEAELC
jgi:hypothetical protein